MLLNVTRWAFKLDASCFIFSTYSTFVAFWVTFFFLYLWSLTYVMHICICRPPPGRWCITGCSSSSKSVGSTATREARVKETAGAPRPGHTPPPALWAKTMVCKCTDMHASRTHVQYYAVCTVIFTDPHALCGGLITTLDELIRWQVSNSLQSESGRGSVENMGQTSNKRNIKKKKESEFLKNPPILRHVFIWMWNKTFRSVAISICQCVVVKINAAQKDLLYKLRTKSVYLHFFAQ